MDDAARLENELLGTRRAWSKGWLDERKVRAICQATAHLEPEMATRVQNQVLPKARRQTVAQLRAALRKAILCVDPDGANERHRKAVGERAVYLYPEEDGMAMIAAYLPAQDALACHQWLTCLAQGMTGDPPHHGPAPRRSPQRAADRATALLRQRRTGHRDRPPAPAPVDRPAGPAEPTPAEGSDQTPPELPRRPSRRSRLSHPGPRCPSPRHQGPRRCPSTTRRPRPPSRP